MLLVMTAPGSNFTGKLKKKKSIGSYNFDKNSINAHVPKSLKTSAVQKTGSGLGSLPMPTAQLSGVSTGGQGSGRPEPNPGSPLPAL